jgi:hypothetical protein
MGIGPDQGGRAWSSPRLPCRLSAPHGLPERAIHVEDLAHHQGRDASHDAGLDDLDPA